MASLQAGINLSGATIGLNVSLAVFKIVIGIVGNSYALIADGIESTTDVASSLIVWSGLKISARPPDECHPYGHGKAESIAGLVVSFFLLCAAVVIAVQSIRGLSQPQEPPAWYTLLALVFIITLKEVLYRMFQKTGDAIDSTALRSEAWHHRSDAITSVAAFVGISVALIGGEHYATADEWAALLACLIIFYNGFRLFKPALNEIMDGAVSKEVVAQVRDIVKNVAGVVDIEKFRIRKSGIELIMDIHITVDARISVEEGHRIAHEAKDRICNSSLRVKDVTVHVEPDNLTGSNSGQC